MRFILLLVVVFLGSVPNCGPVQQPDERDLVRKRQLMVHQQIELRGVKDSRVLRAMRSVPRHEFVPEKYRDEAYRDEPLPIGAEQTISQPYVVAYMTEKLQLQPTDRVLEIGTGSGYQAAVLAEIVDSVYTIEIIESLANTACLTLQRLGYNNVSVRHGDGYAGWPEKEPFDAIIITAAPEVIPEPLKQQLKNGGRMILPIGDTYQELVLVRREDDQFTLQTLLPVRFVPMTGKIQQPQ
jgi:protein-L-isoaspartate(D-aspartate) O-methyltransferase